MSLPGPAGSESGCRMSGGSVCVEVIGARPSIPYYRRSVSRTFASIVWDPLSTLTRTVSPGLMGPQGIGEVVEVANFFAIELN